MKVWTIAIFELAMLEVMVISWPHFSGNVPAAKFLLISAVFLAVGNLSWFWLGQRFKGRVFATSSRYWPPMLLAVAILMLCLVWNMMPARH
jgi:hypothetical protein